eukprot:g520.t1
MSRKELPHDAIAEDISTWSSGKKAMTRSEEELMRESSRAPPPPVRAFDNLSIQGEGADNSKGIVDSQDKPNKSRKKEDDSSTESDSSSDSDNESNSESETDSSSLGDSEDDQSWIQWFCSLKGNEFFCEVPESYIMDDFNLCGLKNMVPYYEYALELILDLESNIEEELSEDQHEVLESAAEMLYGLIHARFIMSNNGLQLMREKFENVDFGRCHRVFCEGQPCLPIGQSDLPRNTTVNVFCPKCRDIYFPKSSRQCNVDGAYFGTSFCHFFLMQTPEAIPEPARNSSFVPKLFGYKISKESVYYNPSKYRLKKKRRERRRGGKRDRNEGKPPTPGMAGKVGPTGEDKSMVEERLAAIGRASPEICAADNSGSAVADRRDRSSRKITSSAGQDEGKGEGKETAMSLSLLSQAHDRIPPLPPKT